jgi:polyisoprenoid-binding protein YceI
MIVSLAMGIQLQAQKYITKNGKIHFYSDAPTEKIEAFNNQVNSALDITSGDFIFRVLMKSFQFEKALMQEHFNENYVESHKFPNASFVGKVTNVTEIDFQKTGTYQAQIEGDLNLHGITQKISEQGTFEVKDGKIHGKSTFYIAVADYDIKIPQAVITNIAEKIEVNVDILLEPLNK